MNSSSIVFGVLPSSSSFVCCSVLYAKHLYPTPIGVLPGKLKSPQMMSLLTASIPRVVRRFANSARKVNLPSDGGR